MTDSQNSKDQNKKNINFRAALKSNSEIYYQMASIFKFISHDNGKLAQKLFNKYHPDSGNEIFLENRYQIEYK